MDLKTKFSSRSASLIYFVYGPTHPLKGHNKVTSKCTNLPQMRFQFHSVHYGVSSSSPFVHQEFLIEKNQSRDQRS